MKARSLSFIFAFIIGLWGIHSTGTARSTANLAMELNGPTVNASNISFSNRTETSVQVNWTNGDGQRRLVLAKANAPVDAFPQDGEQYNAINIFGSGSEIGDGNFVVYSGESDSIVVAGLNPDTAYHFAVLEFNTAGGTMYLREDVPRALLAPYTSANLVCQDRGNLDISNNTVTISELKVVNTGGTNAGGSYVGFYLSSDTIFTTSDSLLGEVFISLLPVNATATISFSKTLTGLDIPPGDYFVGLIVDNRDDVVEFSEDDNNDCFWKTPKVHIANSLPNLRCKFRGYISISGSTYNISGIQIQNNGEGPAETAEIGYYLSTDLNFTTDDLFIGSDDIGALDPGDISTESFSFDPETLDLDPGTYYIGIIVDYPDDIAESNEGDNANCYWSSPRIFISGNEPNLTCAERGHLNIDGTKITISNLKVINNGSATAGASHIAYYLSEDQNFGSGDIKIGEDFVITLSPGSSSIEYFQKDVGNLGLDPGNYYVYFEIDYLDAVQESNESDNICSWPNQPVHINPQKPNLECEDRGTLTINGEHLGISNLKIKNTGNGVAGPSKVGYYLSTDQNFTTSDIRIGTDNVGSLNPWGTSTENFSIDLGTLDLSPGYYFVGVILDYQNSVDETNEHDNNDCFWTHPKVHISAGEPNLTCHSTGHIYIDGYHINISDLKVKNIGSASSAPTRVGFYLSTDTHFTTSDYKIGDTYLPTLDPWQQAILNKSIDIDYDIPQGHYYVGIIIDYQGVVSESNEYDNTCYYEWPKVQIQPQKPNLTCYDRGHLSITGDWLKIQNLKIWNNGHSYAGASHVGYYLSTDEHFTTNDYRIGTGYIPGLDPYDYVTKDFTYDLRHLDIPPGYYYVGIIVDYKNDVHESDEHDNNDCYWTYPKVHVEHYGKPNLACKDKGHLSIDDYKINISGLEIINNGNAVANASKVGYYLSSDQHFDTHDIYIGEDHVSALHPGDHEVESFWKDLSGLDIAPGTYYVGVILDHRYHVDESNEHDNNDCFWTYPRITIHEAGKPNLTCYDKGHLSVYGNSITISGTKVANQGHSSSDGSHVGYYLSSDRYYGSSDYLIGEKYISGISAGYYINVPTFSVDLSSLNHLDIPAGSYHVVLKIDNRHAIHESDEHDNECYWHSPKVHIEDYTSGGCACTNYSGNFCDDFDSYNTGYITPQSVCWSTISGAQRTPQDAKVESQFNNKYLGIHGGENTILRLGNRTSGKYELEFDVFLRTGKRGNYNILHTFTPNSTQSDEEVGAEIYFNGNGSGFVRVANIPYSFVYGMDRWVTIKHVFDFTRNEVKFYVDGYLRRTWHLDDTSTGINGQKKIAGVQFKPVNNSYELFVDDVSFTSYYGAGSDTEVNGRSDEEPLAEYPIDATVTLQKDDIAMTFAPNPARENVVVTVDLPKASDVQLELFSTKGERLRTFELQNVARVTQDIELTDIPAGTYFLRCIAGDQLITKSLVVVR